jgi:hypothetical protein
MSTSSCPEITKETKEQETKTSFVNGSDTFEPSIYCLDNKDSHGMLYMLTNTYTTYIYI